MELARVMLCQQIPRAARIPVVGGSVPGMAAARNHRQDSGSDTGNSVAILLDQAIGEEEEERQHATEIREEV